MSIPIIGNDATVIHMCQALYGMAPGYNVLTTHDAYVAANGTNSYTQALASSFNNLTDTQYAQLLMDNLGFAAVNAANPGASLSTADLAAYLTAAEGGVVSASVRGIVTLQLCNLLASFESATGAQAVYSTIATNFNSQTSNAYTYSTNSANTAPSVVSNVSAGLTVALTSAADQPTLSTSDDTITALLGNFNTNDVIDGKAGNDTLTVRIDGTGAGFAGGIAAQVTNVENINLIAMTESASVSFANMAGYTSVNVWGGSASAELSNLTAVTVGVLSGFGGDLTIGLASETGTSDNLTLNVNNASAFQLLESARAIEDIHVMAAGSGVDIVVDGFSGLSSVDVTGSANVTLTVERQSGVSGLSINASALGGNLTLTLASGLASGAYSAGEIVVKAGTGNDTIIISTTALTFATGLTIDGGAGTDTLQNDIIAAGTKFPTLSNVENLNIVAMSADAGGVTAGMLFSSTTASFSNISLWGTATAVQLDGMTAGATLGVKSGFGGALTVNLETAGGTADAITINADNVGSAMSLHESASTLETITLNFTGTGYSGGSGNLWAMGSADVTIGGSVNVKIGLSFSGFVGTGDVVINATALAGNLNLLYNGTAHAISINAGTGNDTIDLGTSLYGGVNAPTAVVDGGAGTDTLAFVVQSGQSAMPYANSIEGATVTFMSGSEGGNANLGHMSGLTTLGVSFFSASTSNTVTNIASTVNSVTLKLNSGVSAATGALNLNFVSGASAAMTMGGNSADTIANNEWGAINVNSASTLTLSMAGTGAQSAVELKAAQATALTISVTGTGRMSFDSMTANNAGSVVLNANAGGSLVVTSATFATAGSLTLNAAGSANTGLIVHEVALATGYGDLTINASNSALVTVDSALIGDDLTINAIGGDVNVSGIDIIHSTGSRADTAIAINLVAGNTGDVINLNNLHVSAGTGYGVVTMTISGSGNVTMSGLSILTSLASGASALIDATNLVGTLSVSAAGSSNYTILLGNDVNSANCAQGSLNADTIQGGANHDFIVGGAGDDTLGGGGGSDTIIGAAGQDTMSGGAGADSFRFLSHSALDFLDATAGQQDFIVDFGSGDTITFSGITAVGYSAGNTQTAVGSFSVMTASLVGTVNTAGSGQFEVAIFQDSGNTIIQVALGTVALGVGSGLIQVTLEGITSFTSLTSLFSLSMNAANGLTITSV